MIKYLKATGTGFVYGLIHPYKRDTADRRKNMNTAEAMVNKLGQDLGQSVTGVAIAWAEVIAAVMIIGYVGKKLEDRDLKIKMVVDESK